MRAAIFDLDGTLADTAADLIAAANAALAEAGFGSPLDAERHRAEAFAGGRAMLRAGLALRGVTEPGPEVARGYPRLLAHYRDNIQRETRLYPGVEAALDVLAGAGWVLGVCTNKPAALAEQLLVGLGLRPRFAAVLGADSLPVRKPDPLHLWETIAQVGGTPGRSVLIGDTVTDREAARAASVACVLVTFGPEGPGVARMAPEALLDAYVDLPALLERLVPGEPGSSPTAGWSG